MQQFNEVELSALGMGMYFYIVTSNKYRLPYINNVLIYKLVELEGVYGYVVLAVY